MLYIYLKKPVKHNGTFVGVILGDILNSLIFFL